MAVINVATSQNLSVVVYAQDDTINVLDGVTLTINSQWTIRPNLIQALGTGRIEVSNSSTTTPFKFEWFMQNGTNVGGFITQQNANLQVRGGWIIVGTSNGTNNQVLFNANNIGGVAIDFPTKIQVETGNGTDEWEIWNAVPEDVAGGTVNTLGFNAPNTTAGTVAVTAGGVVTGVGTNFVIANIGQPFKLPSIARDFVISAVASTTSMTIQELDGTTYTGGLITAGATYIIRNGSLINPVQVGSSDVGKVLFFNPLTTAVRMGNDINGTKIPTGARVRISNIYINSAMQQTTLATAITGTGAQAFTLATAIGSTTNGTYNPSTAQGTLLLINGSNVERIFYASRTGAVVSATGMGRGAAGTIAQASFPIGTLVYWIPTSNATNNASINASPSGAIDIQGCSLGLRMTVNFSAFASLTLRDFGYAYLANAGNCAGAFDIDGLSGLGIGYQNPNINGGITAQFSALLGIGNIRNVSVTNNLTGGANSYTNIAVGNVQGLTAMSNLRSRHWGRSNAAGGTNLMGVSLQTVKCTTPVTGIYAAGSSVRWNALDNIDTAEIYVSSLPNANTCSSADTFIPINAVGITDSTIRGMQLWGGGLATRGALISIDSGSADVVFHNKNYPVFNGGSQLPAIISDLGLDTIVAHISISNPRITTTQSVLPGTMAFNRGGFHRMLLIDSITATTAGSGANAKGGLGLDVIAGPHRSFQTSPAGTIIPNLADVQPIVVMSNLAKTVGSVYVGGFSSESSFDMYTLTGGTFLDNLGRIYYPAIGDSAIIKSVFPLRGITNFTGTTFDFNYNLVNGNNPVPSGTTLEFRMTNWGTANTGSWTTFTNNASLETARAALTGYSSSVGIDLQFRVTGTTAVAGRYIMSIKLPITIDATYNPPVFTTEIGFNGAQVGTLIAGYINTVPATPTLQSSLLLTTSSGSVPMPYDYDAIPVAYRLVGRLAGWTFSSITGTYTKTAISIPITQNQVMDINGNPLYISGVTGVTVDHVAQTITVSASRSAAQIWSAVQDNLCLLENLTIADPFTTSNGSSFISTYTLIVTGAITAGNITSNVTLSGTLSSGVIITGNVSQTNPIFFNGIIINGNLTYNINSNVNVNFLTTQVSGTVSNLGTGNVLISLLNSTIGTLGTRVTTRLITSFVINGLTDGSQVYVADNLGNQIEYIPNSSTSYTLNTTGGTGTWSYKVTRYGYLAQTGTFTPAVSSFTTTFIDIPDVNITEFDSFVVAGYTTLFFTDQIYDYAAYFETTNVGIKLPRLAGKLLGYVDFGSYDLIFSSTSATLAITGSIIILNIVDLFTGTIFDTGVRTTGSITVGTANIVYPLLLSSSAGQNYWLDITLPTDSSIYIANGSGVQQQYIASSSTSFIYGLPAGTTGDWTLILAKYSFISQSSIFTPNVGGVDVRAISFIPDAFVVDTLSNVIAYTDLNSTQKIKDYSSYFGTTNTGIIIGSVLSKGFGTLTVPSGLTLNPSAVALFAVNSGIVTTKSSGLAEIVTIISSGNFTQGAATLSNDVIIRAANLDSEIVFNATSITFYPTLTDRNAGTNPGVTTTGGIYRYKYGSTYSGVIMIGTLYTRVIQGGIVFFFDKDIIIGNNVIDLSTQGQLSALNQKIELVPQNTWEYENRTLNNALFE